MSLNWVLTKEKIALTQIIYKVSKVKKDRKETFVGSAIILKNRTL